MALTDAQARWISDMTGRPLADVAAPSDPPAAPGFEPGAALREAGAIWTEVERRVEGEIGTLRAALKQFFGGDPAEASMEKEFEAHVHNAFQALDRTLAKDIAAAGAVKTAEAFAPIKADLMRSIEQCRSTIAADPTLALFDDNPYVPLSLQAECDAALQRMAQALTASGASP